MSIQQDINSALGQVGILASLNPTLQQKAQDRAELGKIKKEEKVLDKQFEAVRKDYNKTIKAQLDAENSELEAQKGKKQKVLLSPKVYAGTLEQKVGIMRNLSEKREQLAQKKFDIAPSDENYKKFAGTQSTVKFWKDKQSDIGKPVTYEGEVAQEAIDRAEQKRENMKLNRARRTKLLYGEMERMMPGFKYMEPKKQNKIIKDLGPDERERIKDEAERREKYYGK